MRMKRPVRAAPDQVTITRRGTVAIIAHADPAISVTRLTIGPEIAAMTDDDILGLFNQVIAAQERLASEWDHTVTEIPEGQPQIACEQDCDQWVPRGEVLRCVIEDDGDGEAVIHIDDHELSLREFGRLLTTYSGWGMRIAFVPDNLITENPRLVIGQPRKR
jgi:hypothetical protein